MASLFTQSDYAFNGFEPPGRNDISKRIAFNRSDKGQTNFLEFVDWTGENRWGYLATLLMWETRTGPRNMPSTETITISPGVPLVTPNGTRIYVRLVVKELGPIFMIEGLVENTRKQLGSSTTVTYLDHQRKPVTATIVFRYPPMNIRLRRMNDAGKFIDSKKIRAMDWSGNSIWYTMNNGVWMTEDGNRLPTIPVVFMDGARGTLGFHSNGTFISDTMGFPFKEYPAIVNIHTDTANVIEMTLISLDQSASDSGYLLRIFDDMIDAF